MRGIFAAGSRGRGRQRYFVEVDVFEFFLALVDRVGEEGEFGAVGGSNEVVDAQWRCRERARAGSEIGIFFGVWSFFGGSSGVVRESGI